jgi:glycogenin glucosyltransferase
MSNTNLSNKSAFVTFLMLNDSYLPGALMLAHGLRKQETEVDLVCLITEEITHDARYALRILFDYVVEVEKIYVPHKRRQKRQDRPYFFTRINALRLGEDGDLGFKYKKIVVLDADVLPLKNYGSLFALDAPAGIINERKSHFLETDSEGNWIIPETVYTTRKWKWHYLYDNICPYGQQIPKEITNRVKYDPTNMGINGSLFVLEPSMKEFIQIKEAVYQPDVFPYVSDLFDWPDMQYLTMRWSGKWTNVDLRFSGFNGYPNLAVLFGIHYAGFKPWYINRLETIIRYTRYDDFLFWFKEYNEMLASYPELLMVNKLSKIKQMCDFISSKYGSLVNSGGMILA